MFLLVGERLLLLGLAGILFLKNCSLFLGEEEEEPAEECYCCFSSKIWNSLVSLIPDARLFGLPLEGDRIFISLARFDDFRGESEEEDSEDYYYYDYYSTAPWL